MRILAGDVSPERQKISTAGGMFLRIVSARKGAIPYVSRGGPKLERAEVFDFTVQQEKMFRYWLSNWWFTDCLLQRRSCFGYLDCVGYAQFDWSKQQRGCRTA